jgi:hypothetical protein
MSSVTARVYSKRRLTLDLSQTANVRSCAWGVILFGDALPEIVWRSFGYTPSLALPLIQVIAMLALAVFVGHAYGNKNLVGFVLAVAAMRFGWNVVVPILDQTSIVQQAAQACDPGGKFFLLRFNRLAGAVLLCLTLVGSGLTRQDLFLCAGNIKAPAEPEPWLGLRRRVSWLRFGTIVLFVMSALLVLYMTVSFRPNFSSMSQIGELWCWAVATSAMNAANEEFQFRCVVLGRLNGVAGSCREAMLMSGVLFGVGHYFGQPSGMGGVLTASLAGWLWAKSMLETRGFFWAFTMHFLQDMIIFGFLALTWVNH